MYRKFIPFIALAILLLVVAGATTIFLSLECGPASAAPGGVPLAQGPVGTAFTYQGSLTDGGAPANGAFDLEFQLFDDSTAGRQASSTVTLDDVAITDGVHRATRLRKHL